MLTLGPLPACRTRPLCQLRSTPSSPSRAPRSSTTSLRSSTSRSRPPTAARAWLRRRPARADPRARPPSPTSPSPARSRTSSTSSTPTSRRSCRSRSTSFSTCRGSRRSSSGMGSPRPSSARGRPRARRPRTSSRCVRRPLSSPPGRAALTSSPRLMHTDSARADQAALPLGVAARVHVEPLDQLWSNRRRHGAELVRHPEGASSPSSRSQLARHGPDSLTTAGPRDARPQRGRDRHPRPRDAACGPACRARGRAPARRAAVGHVARGRRVPHEPARRLG